MNKTINIILNEQNYATDPEEGNLALKKNQNKNIAKNSTQTRL